MFDAYGVQHGYMDAAFKLMLRWAQRQPIAGMQIAVVQLPARTPLIFIEVPEFAGGSNEDAVLLYGPLDKQTEMTGWSDGLGPWLPVLRGDKLYGRGGADDGYAIFGSLAAIRALPEPGIADRRCVIVIEACEESGRYELPFYVDHLSARLGKPPLEVRSAGGGVG